MHRSARDQVLSTVELLSYIFQCSSNAGNFANALVCKTWCDEALNVLWRVIWTATRLFDLLAPLEWIVAGEELGFARDIGPEDWARFTRYSWRVHQLADCVYEWEVYGTSALTAISSTRPSTELFPNLRVLHYGCIPQFLPMFLSPSLRELRLYFVDSIPSLAQHMAIQYLPSRAPHLTSLKLLRTSPTDPTAIEPAFSTAIAALSKITSLDIPSNLLTLVNSAIIASLPALRTWTVAHPRDMPLAAGALTLAPKLSDDMMFPSLETLEWTIPFRHAATWFSQLPLLPILTEFQFKPIDVGTPNQYGRLLRDIGARARELKRLSVLATVIYDDAVPTDPACITFVQLEPIVQCTDLTSLQLHHPMPFQLDAAHVLFIVKSLRSLTVLSLNPGERRQWNLPPSLDLDILPALIPYCPCLTFLGLYLDARNPSGQRMKGSFQRLRFLDVGFSLVGDVIEAASFLSAVLPNSCKIHSSYSHSERNKWNQVVELVPAFINVRQEERDGATQP